MKTLSRAMLLMQMGTMGASEKTMSQTLPPAPDTIETFAEIAVSANGQLPNLFNALTPQERVFAYYLMRASLPGHRILVDQLHRHGQELIDMFETLLHSRQEILVQLPAEVGPRFLEQATTYLVYLWTNHGQYFSREFSNEKRTPARLKLDLLTKERLIEVFNALGKQDKAQRVNTLDDILFDETVEPTCTVAGSIEKSAVNMYTPDFTEQDFATLPAKERSAVNMCFSKDRSYTYKMGEKFDQELSTAHYWLKRAHDLAEAHPNTFDQYIPLSLKHLMTFLETGEEAFFKKHCSAWLKSNSRIDYTFGFIEVYQDPKGFRGMFEAEVTIKSLDINSLNALLPSLEARLPFPPEHQRENLHDTSALPNASINTQVFGSGEFGPMAIVAAYCLPNYNEIRSQEGSKQIIYHTQKGLGARINPELSRTLNHLKKEAEWLKANDPDGQLFRDLWTLHVILHETLGHGSGRLDVHTDQETGKSTPVTSENLPSLLSGYESTLEELRAEIIALHTSIDGYETLKQSGFLYDWPKKMSKSMLVDCLITEMAQTGLRRLLTQQDDATEITGDHARANVTILNYLLAGGGLALREESVMVNGKEHTVLGLEVVNQDKACQTIKELAIKVQTIKSTGDGVAAKELIDTYGKKVNQHHIAIMKANHKAVVGQLKATVHLYPIMDLVTNEHGDAVDVTAHWPKDIVEQQLWWAKHALLRA